jgi:demethylmenaquinone methyltransferase/2-methoxy-6-polyprenyl-1,4-benzoquinol methylase
VLSLGLDRVWRRRAVAELVGCRRVCDLGAGTGDMSTALFSQRRFTGEILALDPTVELWRRAEPGGVLRSNRCRFAQAEGEHLPLSDGSCDAVISGFVMRNFFDLELALRECSRVTRPGGRAVFLEMGQPRNRLWRGLFEWYFHRLVPTVCARLARHGEAYRYLPGSVARFPRPDEVRDLFLANGFSQAEYKEYLGGAVVAYRATR